MSKNNYHSTLIINIIAHNERDYERDYDNERDYLSN